jgi:dienelactone hydrolase
VAARRNFATKLRVRGPAPQEYEETPVPEGAAEVTYSSGDLKLTGWVSRNTVAGNRMPAVVFLHGGFSHSLEDWEGAAPFVEAGFLLFMPRLRAENGGPGVHESFLGEVDDALAAGTFIAANPNVDPSRVFVAGHSVGAVLTTLTSLLPSPFRAAAAFDGYLDMKTWARAQPPGGVPYEVSVREVHVRNPMDFISSLRGPIRLYVSTEGVAQPPNKTFAANARREGKDCEVVVVTGDHSTMLDPAIRKAIPWFQGFTAR